MLALERKQYILSCLNAKGIINLKDIARELDISEITVRRDFEKLENEGKLKKVVGGATLGGIGELDAAELTMKAKVGLNSDEKSRIAKYAAQFVSDGDCVFLDGGTTMIPLAEALSSRKIKIVTYNAMILNSRINPVAEIFIIGGKYLPHYGMMVGPVAQEILRQFNFDIAFLGCAGIDVQQGWTYTTEMESLLMKRIALENSARSYLLADDSKFQQRGFLKFSEVHIFQNIISNQQPGFKVALPNLSLI